MLKTRLPPDNSALLEQAMAAVAAAMADPSRVKMLCALMDGRAWTATELSAAADVAPSTASGHLTRLLDGKLITCLSQGRHRYYRLAGHDVAELVEQMMGLSWSRITPPETTAPKALREARTCYDHLAGTVAVQIYDFMQAQGWLETDGSALTVYGREQFLTLGISLSTNPRRKACCACLDWSERRFHLGGEAGAALLAYLDSNGWIQRVAGFRDVVVTASGNVAIKKRFSR
ncbi:TPA: winged helix-turn-helix transcriptional regulator [Enterobacter ludwigii]|jgi:DNA-binding transcriptional ArsR family regulator|uniref:ArsR/SmtB family transcription factor n=1 Tax=Enterobacter ludwigii TaxID=299767 RepID=UPI0015E73ABD|nr:winged helix-turn-helix domain-containing protein [Enterobacter ludwigii]EKS7111161.1 winged helix-turn-helix transcriptional regulator [Enterobacter ludwigii]EKS7113651.1 winged helix-turn-helix transcriptional regulator [Enterobacter ludwigii]EKS7200306.1 winged helix-turn-helix transcriptional regulator [Enterobacter ludwigii]MBX9029789.1 winged helix-turn-helix transcriptional regulator [Enterobacter ludwigii]HDR2536116.1 winged helix-turn-helix transcriptional regulator [Enterobacter l